MSSKQDPHHLTKFVYLCYTYIQTLIRFETWLTQTEEIQVLFFDMKPICGKYGEEHDSGQTM